MNNLDSSVDWQGIKHTVEFFRQSLVILNTLLTKLCCPMITLTVSVADA